MNGKSDSDDAYLLEEHPISSQSDLKWRSDPHSRNLYQTLAPNRTQLDLGLFGASFLYQKLSNTAD